MASAVHRKRPGAGGKKQRAARQTSNVFAMFEQTQIHEFKEAFNMIDTNKDGFITAEDLREIYGNLGKDVSDEFLASLLSEASGAQMNFTMFLTLFGEKLQGTDQKHVIQNAFACFDEEGTGLIHEDKLKEALMTMGERFSEEMCDEILRDAPVDENGYLKYNEFAEILKSGSKDKDEL
ncbi:myosin regulatory light polypeptide 9-like [Symsagittifera roscoffensis]|uniref:myosin regulatory light polypeptide 9-like n=1 Tax=Symsagittifera roscoffensis TaxID=84072 RepID=UPI00307BC141